MFTQVPEKDVMLALAGAGSVPSGPGEERILLVWGVVQASWTPDDGVRRLHGCTRYGTVREHADNGTWNGDEVPVAQFQSGRTGSETRDCLLAIVGSVQDERICHEKASPYYRIPGTGDLLNNSHSA